MKPDVFILFFPVHSFIRKKAASEETAIRIQAKICNFFNLNSINHGGEVSDRLLPEHFNDIEVLLKLH